MGQRYLTETTIDAARQSVVNDIMAERQLECERAQQQYDTLRMMERQYADADRMIERERLMNRSRISVTVSGAPARKRITAHGREQPKTAWQILRSLLPW